MTLFRYAALDGATGREIRGELDAADARAAAALLRESRLLPFEIGPSAATSGAAPVAGGLAVAAGRPPGTVPTGLGSWSPVVARDIVFFLRQLALMLRAGLTLLQALDVGRRQARKRGLHRAITAIRGRIEAGRTVADAFAAEHRYLPPFAAKLLASAEAAGELDATLDRLADYVDQRIELRNSILATLTYPLLVMTFTSGVFLYLVTSVFPKFVRFLQRRGGTLPWATRFLMSLDELLVSYWPLLVAGCAGGIVAFLVLRRTRAGQRAIDRALLHVPAAGGLLEAGAMQQLTRTLAMLLRSGVPLVEALRGVAPTISNAAVEAHVEAAAANVLRGGELAPGLDGGPIPPLLSQIVATGEQTGTLDSVLEEAGRYYELEVKRRVKLLAAFFEPFFIVVVGGLVGFVYFAFFQALYQAALGAR